MLRMLLTGVLAFFVTWFLFLILVAVSAAMGAGDVGVPEFALMLLVSVGVAIWAARREGARPSI
jgi:hypothetical protein